MKSYLNSVLLYLMIFFVVCTGVNIYNNTHPNYGSAFADVAGVPRTSADLADMLSDETGTGAAVFGTSPTFTTNAKSPLWKSTDSDTADNSAGIALGNADTLCWEASPAGTDVCVSVDTSENVNITGGGFDAADILTGTLPDARLSAVVSLLGQSISFISPAEIVDECAALQSVRRNSGDTAWECYTPASTPVSAANGGTGIDTSGSTGYPSISAGTWSVGGIAQSCELIDEGPQSSDEVEFCEKPVAITATAIRCECYGTCTTPPSIKLCKGEDLGNDTCTTNLLSSTESTTLSCTASGGSDTSLNSTALTANQGVTLQITNSPSSDSDRVRVVLEYTQP